MNIAVSGMRPGAMFTEDLLWIEQARGAAALAVVILHVSAGVVRGVSDVTSAAWWIGNIVDSAMRWCVPVFVMISGALLLDPAKSLGSFSTFYSRRASRIGWPLVFWSALFLIWNGWRGYLRSGHVDWDAIIGMLLSGQPHYHLWYLFMLLGLYLVAPFVRVLLNHLDRPTTMCFCSLLFVLSLASALHDHVAGARRAFFLFWFLPYLSYFTAGAVMRRSSPKVGKGGLLGLVLSSVAFTAIGCYVVSVWTDVPSGLYFYDYFSVTVIPMAIAVFILLRETPPSRVLVGLAPYSLGVYLVHPLFLDGLSRLGFKEWQFNPLWSIPVEVLLVLLLSLSSVWAIRRVSILRRLV